MISIAFQASGSTDTVIKGPTKTLNFSQQWFQLAQSSDTPVHTAPPIGGSRGYGRGARGYIGSRKN